MRTLRLFRLKRRQPQVYPLISSVAEALARYIDTVRPPSSCPEVFLCMQAPRRPLKAGSIYDVANRRFVALGIEAAHRGGHALRHACASRLLAEGLSIKEIGDHLGHSSAASTSIYAKVNLAALREVAAFDLGDAAMMLIDVIDNYLAQKRSLGMRFESPEVLLRRFCRVMGNPEIREITPEMVAAFLHGSGPLSSAWMFRHRVLSGFYRFAVSRGHAAFSPLPTTIPKLPPQQTPYVYSTEELRRLLDATSILKVRQRPQVPAIYRTLLLLLYGSGMRIGEALRLVLHDVDLTEQIITVRDTKFFKTRLVPIGPKLNCELAAHIERRRLLPLSRGRRISVVHHARWAAVALRAGHFLVPAYPSSRRNQLPYRRASTSTTARYSSHGGRAPGDRLVSLRSRRATVAPATRDLSWPHRYPFNAALSAHDAGSPRCS